MSRLRTFRRGMDSDAVDGALKNQQPRVKKGTIHEHQYSALQKNWQGREFDRCLTCGAVFFLEQS